MHKHATQMSAIIDLLPCKETLLPHAMCKRSRFTMADLKALSLVALVLPPRGADRLPLNPVNKRAFTVSWAAADPGDPNAQATPSQPHATGAQPMAGRKRKAESNPDQSGRREGKSSEGPTQQAHAPQAGAQTQPPGLAEALAEFRRSVQAPPPPGQIANLAQASLESMGVEGGGAASVSGAAVGTGIPGGRAATGLPAGAARTPSAGGAPFGIALPR